MQSSALYINTVYYPQHIKILGWCVQRSQFCLMAEGAYLALIGHPYRADVLLHRPSSHPIFSYWVG